jgi:predicted type IV restriction endonuclease
MERVNPNVDKEYMEEKDKFESDIETWEWCYARFKSKIDKIVEYERRVEKLEAELRDRDRIVDLKFKEERANISILMVIFVIASVIFVKVTSQSQNVWAYFITGLLIGIGWTVIIKLVKRSEKSLK